MVLLLILGIVALVACVSAVIASVRGTPSRVQTVRGYDTRSPSL